jgi:signal transduction histidine kinase
MAWLRSEVQAASNGADQPPGPALVREVLSTVRGRGPEVNAFFYYLPADPSQPVTSVEAGPVGAPELPWYARARARLAKDGPLRISPLALWGRHGRLEVRWRGQAVDLGSLAVLIPNYRARGPSIVRPLKELLVFFLALFAVCAGIVLFTVAQVITPIRRLEERADQMARGELAMPVSSAGEGDEVGRLTFALEEMRRALREKLRSTEEVNLDLERAVQRRTADLAKKNRELAETLQKLTRAQDQLVRSEKLASIGQLVAGIAHEINNPVNAIVNTVGPLQQAIDEANSDDPDTRTEAAKDMRDMIRVVQSGATRTKDIVQALHNYSRTDDESVVSVDLNHSIDDSLELLRHVTKQSIEIDRDYGDVGRIEGHAGQLNQVFMNLLTNAAQAIGGREGAVIRIETRLTDGDAVEIRITDNGPGIPEDVLGRIFDPFFTTKDVGEGSGLGLSIVHGIVERHGGTIEVHSEPGEGTTFTLVLPRSPDQPLVRASTAI